MSEGTVPFVLVLPHPWPPAESVILHRQPFEAVTFELNARFDGKISLTVTDTNYSNVRKFISQPIEVLGSRPRPTTLILFWDSSRCWLRMSGQDLLADADRVPSFRLPALLALPIGKSFDEPNAHSVCQPWITRRATKFAAPRIPKPNRHAKTINEEVADLQNSVARIDDLRNLVVGGKKHMLGTLAGELRASVYWKREAGPERSYNPLLLRMASKSDLALPVFSVPSGPEPPIISEAIFSFVPNIPRLERLFPTDELSDLQEWLSGTVMRVGPSPGKLLTAKEVILELSVTMGAAHYDEDASDFLELMKSMESFRLDQLSTFICQTASTISSLSEWVLSRFKI
jgi:hypothetical protein